MLKISENPPIAWPEEKSIKDFDGYWWVAHTKSRNEKALANDLVAREVSYFLPMSWKIRSHRGRKTRSLLPLFGGYLFFCGKEKQRLEVLKTNRVANLIEVNNQEKFLSELLQIELALKSGISITQHKYLQAGRHCQVTAGPLAGLGGIIVKTKNAARLVLRIDMLGQAASVEIDTDLIEILD